MPIANDASKGLVTARDASTLRQGELSEAVGVEYRVGSPHLYKLPGRSSLNVDLGATIQGIVKAQYDSASDVLIAVAGGEVFESAASVTPSFTTSGLSGLDDTVSPQFVGFNERWLMCNGVDANYIREPEAVPGGSDGNWRPAGMAIPTEILIATVNTTPQTVVRPTTNDGGSFSYTLIARAYDADPETFATTDFDIVTIGGIQYAKSQSVVMFTSNFAINNTTLYVDHSQEVTGGGQVNYKTEFSLDAGANWNTLSEYISSFDRVVDSIALTTGMTIANLLYVRFTSLVVFDAHGLPGYPEKVYDVRVGTGETLYQPPVAPDVAVPVGYSYTELYIDSQDVEHESKLASPLALTTISTTDMATAVSITLTLPTTPKNPLATFYLIYRTVDDGSGAGGYPLMYQVGRVAVTATTWTDDFTDDPKFIPTSNIILKFFNVTFPTGETLPYEFAAPPPLSKMAIPFQGVVAYIPAATGQGHFLFYSVASTISPQGIEQVPEFQYLDFQSPRNDTITTAVTTNGGKSLLVFFSNYTMLVNYLPQASDGVFENRIKEYVSNNRGSAGRLTSCEFTLSAGQTLVASVDALGLWVTNGVNQMDEWSRDLNWKVDMAGVDLTTAELVDNTAKRRLELLYSLNGQRKERHFFYGRLKEDGDGKPSPCMTGPHPSGCRVKHYTQIATDWVGFGGDNSATGDLFLEEGSDADESHGYDSLGSVPTSFALADQYVGGISKAQIIESITSRWGLTPSKTMAFEIQITRDSGHSYTRSKTITTTPGVTSYIHGYGDRAKCRFTDISPTAAPEFIGLEIETRDGGPARDA